MVAAANTHCLAGCKPSPAGVLSRAHIWVDMGAPCVLGLLGFRSAKQARTYGGDH